MTIPVKNPFISAVRSGVKVVSSVNYTLTDIDGFDTVLVTTGASDRTITLPAGSLSIGRRIKIRKQDSGAGKVILSSAASEQIDGVTLSTNAYYLSSQHAYVEVICDGTNWSVIGTGGDYLLADVNNITQGSGSVTDLRTFPNISAGIWEVFATANIENNTAGTIVQLGTNTVSTTLTNNEGKDHTYQTFATTGPNYITSGPTRYTVTGAATTIYMPGLSTNAGVANWYVRFRATRIR